MRPSTAIPRAAICSFCAIRQPAARLVLRAPLRVPGAVPRFSRALCTTPRLFAATPPPAAPAAPAPAANPFQEAPTFAALSDAIAARILAATAPPPEDEVLAALAALRTHIHEAPPAPAGSAPAYPAVSALAYAVLAHAPVFLSPGVLGAFVALQAAARDPAPLPAAFALYANKPIVRAGGGAPVAPNPRQVKYAVPPAVALRALETAIGARDMTAALDVVDTAYGAPAFRRSKFVRRALPGFMIGGMAPGAIWVLAQQIAGLQDTVEQAVAQQYAFGGLVAYVGLTGFLGLVALGTRNDQMVRVTWITGTPLRERWVREEERAALDAIAMAWGFEDKNRRGLEEGDEWELLREVVGRKGMVLDEPSLMEGME